MTRKLSDTETTPADVEEWFASLSNWGRWGQDDEYGTLNLITASEVQRALALATVGQTVSCSRTISTRGTPDNLHPMLHFMVTSGEGAPAVGWHAAVDWIGLEFHGFGTTHLDSLGHVFWNGKMYNGRPAAAVTTATGCGFGSIELASRGIIGRGVLLDVPRALGREWLDPGEGITPGDLDACERRQDVQLSPGDLLMVRTGRDARSAERGALDVLQDGYAGLEATCLPWLRERDVAVLGSDMVSDVSPSRVPGMRGPIHAVGIVGMGLWLLDNAYLDDLAAVCAQHQRWEFLLVISPLRLKRTTGSPVNPIAIF